MRFRQHGRVKNNSPIRLVLAAVLVFGTLAFGGRAAWAIPSLQLDIAGGFYNTATETIVGSTNPFTLYALLIPDSTAPLSDTYYISAALLPKTSTSATLGSFVFGGLPVSVTQGMVYGTPPIETVQSADPHDLPAHGVFPTYFTQFSFSFNSINRATAYNSQTTAGAGPVANATGTMYYAAFTVDTTLLDPNYTIHFDLYNAKTYTSTYQDCDENDYNSGSSYGSKKKKSYGSGHTYCHSYTVVTDIDVNQFAPFSHDAESGHPVPEPTSLLLLGSGLIGLEFLRRKRKR